METVVNNEPVGQNDQAQLRAAPNETPQETRPGALAAASCSALNVKRYYIEAYSGNLAYEENGARQYAENKHLKIGFKTLSLLKKLGRKLSLHLQRKLSQQHGIKFAGQCLGV